MRSYFERLVGGRAQLERITTEAIRPVVQYTELVSALQGLAELAVPAGEGASGKQSGFGAGLSPKKESVRLRSMVERDEEKLAELETLFCSLDVDSEGRLGMAEVEAAVSALQPEGSETISAPLLEQLRNREGSADGEAILSVDRSSFLSLMVDKAVQDFAAGEQALLPAFEALDGDGDGTISQADLVAAIDTFCNARPLSEGCEIPERTLRLAEAFDAFAGESQRLDYERFVEMVSGRNQPDLCELGEEEEEEDGEEEDRRVLITDMMGERECFGQAITEDGEEDLACDAWFYGEDPTEVKKEVVTDQVKIAALRAAGEAAIAQRKQREAAMRRPA